MSLRKCGFKAIVTGADRHGSFIWAAARRDEIIQTITVRFTLYEDMVLAQAQAAAALGVHVARERHGQCA